MENRINERFDPALSPRGKGDDLHLSADMEIPGRVRMNMRNLSLGGFCVQSADLGPEQLSFLKSQESFFDRINAGRDFFLVGVRRSGIGRRRRFRNAIQCRPFNNGNFAG
jgi:hypothetical protein